MRRLRVWLVNTWEMLPIEGESVRPKRAGLLAQALHERGHDVTWWTSSFSHEKKRMRLDPGRPFTSPLGYRIGPIPALGYRQNVSIARLLDHRYVAKRMTRIWVREPEKPDVIVSSCPPIDAAHAAITYGVRNKIPTILDVRDQWPDSFYDVLPPAFNWVGRFAAWPMSWKANQAFKNATALIANGPDMLEWAIQRSGRKRNSFDRFFPMSYPDATPTQSQIEQAERFWRELDVTPSHFLVVFVGSIVRHFNFAPLIQAARVLAEQEATVKFIVCGDGPEREDLMTLAKDLPNVVFPGWVDYPQIFVVLRWAALGIAPYKDTSNFRYGITNKPIEYLSASLPLLMPFSDGYIWELLKKRGCGIEYNPEDPDSLVKAIVRLKQNERELFIMRNNAGELFRERFAFNVVYKEMVDFVERVAHSRMAR